MFSTRINPAYAAALFALRCDIVNRCDPAAVELLMDRVQDLADQLVRGTVPLVQVPVDEPPPASPGDEVVIELPGGERVA